MATLPLKALWIGGKPVAFGEGSTLDTDLTTLVVVSIDERLPIGVGEKVSLKVELNNGRIYAGNAVTKMPRDVGGRDHPVMHVYEMSAASALDPAD
jgi:hypothetical protein